MKTEIKPIATLVAALVLTWVPRQASAQGMPAEAHDNIHTLFNQHTDVTRNVTMTKDGYVAVTESKDPRLAKVLREHVNQMRERYQSGRMVRGWDPAFRELREHYDDITHRVEATKHGLKITVKGKTPAAIKVAKSHANIVSNFAKKGWGEHDVRHPRVVGDDPKVEPSAKACCQAKVCKSEGAEKKSCCGKGGCKECAKPAAATR